MTGAEFLERMAQAKKDIIERCRMCGSCLKECKIRSFSQYAGADPAELQKARIEFLKGGEFSQAAYDLAFSCMSCHYCREACPENLNPPRIGILSRIELVSRGHAAPPAYSFAFPDEHFNYFGIMSALLLHPSQTRWLTQAPERPQHADVVYFTGCGLHTMPDHLFTSLDIMERMGLDIATLGGIAHCCGNPYMLAGRSAECGNQGERLLKALADFTPETVTFFCSGCTARFGASFTDHAKLPFRALHLAAFLGEHVDRLKFTKEIHKVVAVHDPCQLGRGVGEYEGVRKVLGAIPGIRLVEMEHSGKNTLCCGSPAAQNDPQAAREMARTILEEAKSAGAELLVDMCLSCHRAFRALAKDYPFEVIHFINLVGKAMGIEHESKLAQYLQWKDVDRVLADARANIEASPYSEEEVSFFLQMLFASV